jgi:hypothetical protein
MAKLSKAEVKSDMEEWLKHNKVTVLPPEISPREARRRGRSSSVGSVVLDEKVMDIFNMISKKKS